MLLVRGLFCPDLLKSLLDPGRALFLFLRLPGVYLQLLPNRSQLFFLRVVPNAMVAHPQIKQCKFLPQPLYRLQHRGQGANDRLVDSGLIAAQTTKETRPATASGVFRARPIKRSPRSLERLYRLEWLRRGRQLRRRDRSKRGSSRNRFGLNQRLGRLWFQTLLSAPDFIP